MIRVIAIVLAFVLVIGIIGSAIFMAVKVGGYMINQNFDFETAWEWAKDDFVNFVTGIFGKANSESEDYFEWEYTVNKYIDVVGCTSLKFE